MKKSISIVLATLCALVLIATGCATTAPSSSSTKAEAANSETANTQTANNTTSEQKSIGYTVQDLTNPIWASTAEEAKKIAAENNIQITVLDCKNNSATQISQVENFIQDGVDCIIINPADVAALTSVLKDARAKGIKIVSYDVDFDECDAKYIIDNYTLGKTIGTEAANWINEKHGGTCEVAVIDYPLIPDIIARAQGIIDAINDLSPNAEIVAQATAATAQQGMEITENFLQSNPDIKVIASIGDGGAIGANEVVKAAGKNTDDFGIFSADATDEALSKIANGESLRMSVMLDNPSQKAANIMDLAIRLMGGESGVLVTYADQVPIDASNVAEFYSK